MRRSPIIFCGVMVVCAAWGTVELTSYIEVASETSDRESYDYRDGKQEAGVDIASGTPKWKTHGLVHDYDQTAADLRKSLGVELDWFQGCIGSEGITRYTCDYNSATWAHLVGIFGEDTVRESIGPKPINRSFPTEEANQPVEPTPGDRGGSP